MRETPRRAETTTRFITGDLWMMVERDRSLRRRQGVVDCERDSGLLRELCRSSRDFGPAYDVTRGREQSTAEDRGRTDSDSRERRGLSRVMGSRFRDEGFLLQ